MKNSTSLLVAAAALLTAATGFAQFAVNWSTLDSGGGTSTNGAFSLSGTVGQPDAGGPMANGAFSLVGGFWGVVGVVQTPGAPWLAVQHAPTNMVIVSWPLPEAGWRLQVTTNLTTSPIEWTDLPAPYATNATSLLFVEPASSRCRIYRLYKP